MSRKPIDEQQPSECRQAIWVEIKLQGGAFTQNDLNVRLNPASIREYLVGLCAAGYLERIEPEPFVPTIYRLIKDCGHDAPRVRNDGTPVTQGQGRQQMWNAMRVLKSGFNATDLAFNATTDDHRVDVCEAKTYLGALHKAGYLRQTSPSKPGIQARYMLIPSMWTGPQPPQIQRTKQVYDPNLRKVVWSKVEGAL